MKRWGQHSATKELSAEVPDQLTSGQPPFSPEWYAGAKERHLSSYMTERVNGLNDAAEWMCTFVHAWKPPEVFARVYSPSPFEAAAA